MRQSLQFEMHLKSENRIRGQDWKVLHGRHASDREKVKKLLDKHIARRRMVVHGESNRFVIFLCRISAGFLDSEDNLTGAFKHVKDAVSRWLGFSDDSDKRLTWRYQQQACPRGWHGVRVTIDDEEIGDEIVKVVGSSPDVLGEVTEGSDRGDSRRGGLSGLRASKRGATGARSTSSDARNGGDAAGHRARGKAAVGAVEQHALVFRKVYAALPWDVPEGSDRIVATHMREFDGCAKPPEQLGIRVPTEHVHRMMRRFGAAVSGLGASAGRTLMFELYEHDDPALGGACLLYMPVELDEQPGTTT